MMRLTLDGRQMLPALTKWSSQSVGCCRVEKRFGGSGTPEKGPRAVRGMRGMCGMQDQLEGLTFQA